MTSLTPGQFIIELQQFARKDVPEFVQVVTQKISLIALRGVVLKSPVLTGRFRGNWNVSVDEIDFTTTEDVDKSGGPTISRGTPTIEAAEAFQTIWIANSLPYALPLEGGHSERQAPNGMVALTLTEIEVIFEDVI